jgi:hypothetical protein
VKVNMRSFRQKRRPKMGKEKVGMKVFNLDSVSLKGWMETWNEALKWSWRSYLEKKCCCGKLVLQVLNDSCYKEFYEGKRNPTFSQCLCKWGLDFCSSRPKLKPWL